MIAFFDSVPLWVFGLLAYLALGYQRTEHAWRADWNKAQADVINEASLSSDAREALSGKDVKRNAKITMAVGLLLVTLFWPLWSLSKLLTPKDD